MPTEIVNFTRVLLVAFTTLFPVVNPIGCAPIFLSLTQHFPQSVRGVLSSKIATYSFAILAVSLLFGTPILNFFGISIEDMFHETNHSIARKQPPEVAGRWLRDEP